MQHHLTFMHVPKTAGTSLVRTIVDCVGYSQVDAMHDGAAEPLDPSIAVAGRVLVGHLAWTVLAPLAGQTRFVTVLRDPLSRAASLYRFWREADQAVADAGPPSYALGSRLAKELSFEEFLRNEHPYVASQVRDGQARFLLTVEEWRARNRNLTASLALCQKRLAAFSVVGTTNDLPGFINRLAAVDERFAGASVPHLNKTVSASDNNYSAQAELLRQFNPLDVLLYETAMECTG